MDRTVTESGRALVAAMAGDRWRLARAALIDLLWHRASLRPQLDSVSIELDELRALILQARSARDEDTERALEGAWQIRLQQLVSADPAIAEDLRHVLADFPLPALSRRDEVPPPGRYQEGSPGSDSSALRIAVIGQAAAGLTAVAALIYGSGALTIALRLFFTHLSWETVLGQLPRDVILTSGFGQIVLPAVIIGVLSAVLLNFVVNGSHRSKGVWSWLQLRLQRYLTAKPSFKHFLAWLVISAAIGVSTAAISLPDYNAHAASYAHPQVVIPTFNAIFVAAVISTVAVGITLILLPPPTNDRLRPELSVRQPAAGRGPSGLTSLGWMVWVGSLVAFAAIPGISTFNAVTLFPATLACSTQFKGGELAGNLIATNGGWAYMVEYRTADYSRDYIAVVPLSSLQLETIGYNGDCATLSAHPG